MEVFVVHHVHELEEDREDVKLIGVYSTEETANAAVKRLSTQPGFRDTPDGFHIDRGPLGKLAKWNARIPRIACAARFMSFTVARNPSKAASTLAVLWFQEEFGLPGEEPFGHLQKLDWDAKATDFDW